MWLSPDVRLSQTLRALGVDPDETRVAPVDGGLSGARLTRLRMSVPAGKWPGAPTWRGSRVVKEAYAEGGWIAAATHDTRIREVALWQTGLMARFPRQIGLAVLRAAPPDVATGAPTEGALLLRDVRARMMRRPYRTPPGHLPPEVLVTVDALAALHARFWESPALDDPRLGLASVRDTLLWLAPAAIEEAIAAGQDAWYLELARRGWEAFFQLIASEDAATLQATLDAPERILSAIARLPRTLVHGDAWGPNMGRLPPAGRPPRTAASALLIDWALAAAAPCTWDPVTLCGAWHTLAPVTLLAAYRPRLNRRLRSRGITLTPETWRLLAASAYLRATLSTGEAYARAVTDARGRIDRDRALSRLRWWASRGARAARLLMDR